MIEHPDLENLLIDSTVVRAHACSARAKGGGEQALGRSKGGFSPKIHAVTDGLGNPIDFTLTGGHTHDVTEAPALLLCKKAERVLVDKGYDSNELIRIIRDLGAEPVIPPRKNRKELREYDRYIYKQRHLIECFFSKIKYYRRVFSRFDKLARNYWSFVCFASALIWLR